MNIGHICDDLHSCAGTHTHVRMYTHCRYCCIHMCVYLHLYNLSRIPNNKRIQNLILRLHHHHHHRHHQWSMEQHVLLRTRVSLSYNLPTQGTEKHPQRTNPQIAMPFGQLLHSLHWTKAAATTQIKGSLDEKLPSYGVLNMRNAIVE